MEKINKAVIIANRYNPDPNSKAYIGSANVALGIASNTVGLVTTSAEKSGVDEKDAVYNLKVKVEEGNFSVDIRFLETEC